MTDLKSMTLEEITAALRAMGEPSFRGKQVFTWLHRGITDFDEMMNIPKSLREKLRAEYYITVPTVARKQVSKLDGTIKYLWELQDGNCIETVLMSYHHGNTVCISSQVGCRMGCKFCASTLAGKVRDLTPSEMLDQVLFTQLDSGREISNIVLMGMGEPLLNYENVLAAIERITAEDGLGMSPYRLTLSTSGIVEGIKRLADDDVRFNLAISLHSAVNTTRDKIMPINKAYPLTELAEAIRYFVDKTGTRPTFEYLLLKGVNDSLDDAKALALFCRQFPVKINIIEYNEVANAPYRHSPDASRDQFVRYLESKNIVVNIRRSKGKDIDAACGQLANKNS